MLCSFMKQDVGALHHSYGEKGICIWLNVQKEKKNCDDLVELSSNTKQSLWKKITIPKYPSLGDLLKGQQMSENLAQSALVKFCFLLHAVALFLQCPLLSSVYRNVGRSASSSTWERTTLSSRRARWWWATANITWCDSHAVAATPHYRWTTSPSSNVSPQVGKEPPALGLNEGAIIVKFWTFAVLNFQINW